MRSVPGTADAKDVPRPCRHLRLLFLLPAALSGSCNFPGGPDMDDPSKKDGPFALTLRIVDLTPQDHRLGAAILNRSGEEQQLLCQPHKKCRLSVRTEAGRELKLSDARVIESWPPGLPPLEDSLRPLAPGEEYELEKGFIRRIRSPGPHRHDYELTWGPFGTCLEPGEYLLTAVHEIRKEHSNLEGAARDPRLWSGLLRSPTLPIRLRGPETVPGRFDAPAVRLWFQTLGGEKPTVETFRSRFGGTPLLRPPNQTELAWTAGDLEKAEIVWTRDHDPQSPVVRTNLILRSSCSLTLDQVEEEFGPPYGIEEESREKPAPTEWVTFGWMTRPGRTVQVLLRVRVDRPAGKTSPVRSVSLDRAEIPEP